MFPEDFITRINSQKNIDSGALLKSLSEPEPVSIRLNPAKWHRKPVDAIQVPWCDEGWHISKRPSFTLDPLFHSGCYYPQEASSMFIGKVFNDIIKNQTGLRVLDLCGAPGGKSTHISSVLGNRGFIVANEVIRQRASVLAETVTKWGTGNSVVTQNDPEVLGKLNGFFDVILVDAPCSGEGMFRDKVARDEWSVENTCHCSERQKRILMDIWPALKENGILIYSTCTFNPDENEKNIKWLTDKHHAESVSIDITDFEPIERIEFMGIEGYCFYPHKLTGNGFFISVLRKLEKADSGPTVYFGKSENQVTKNDIRVAAEWTTFDSENIFRAGDDLFGIAAPMEDFHFLKKRTRVIKGGTHLCSIKKSTYIPVHELAMSAYLKNNVFPSCDADYQKAVSLLRRDNTGFSDLAKGWHTVRYNSVNLGFINNIGQRNNNYYPMEWRIRMSSAKPGEENIIEWD